jgi:hypothetical protein
MSPCATSATIMDNHDVPRSMNFKDTAREIARLLAVFLGAVLLAHLSFLIATWFRPQGHG